MSLQPAPAEGNPGARNRRVKAPTTDPGPRPTVQRMYFLTPTEAAERDRKIGGTMGPIRAEMIGFGRVPQELRDRPQWVVWRYALTKDKSKWTKVPHQALIPGRKASSTDPKTWATFEEAERAFYAFREARERDRIDGIGFVFSKDDPYCGVDLDHSLHPGGGCKHWTHAYLDDLNSYTECSPSGTGVKVIVRGVLPSEGNKKTGIDGDGGAVEMYDRGRFFTITAERFDRWSKGIEDRADVVNRMHAELFPPKPKPEPKPKPVRKTDALPGDDELVALAIKYNPAFGPLYVQGDTTRNHGDDSSADFALCTLLAYWFNRDEAAVDRVFRRSALFREKWDERRGDTTYGALTVANAVAVQTKVYEPRSPKPAPDVPRFGPEPSTNGNGHPPAEPPVNGQIPDPVKPNEAPDDPHRLARLFRDTHCRHKDGATVRYWQGEFQEWDRAYRPVPSEELRARLAAKVKAEFNRINVKEIALWEADAGAKKPPKPKVRKVTGQLVGNVALALGGYTLLPARTAQPAWLIDNPPFPADEVLPARNALIHLPGLISDKPGSIRPPTPLFFCPYVLDYDFDRNAENPVEWFKFLTSLWGDDDASTKALQEWMGYLLTLDTRQQKILMLIGPKRSGKGTIARVIKAMIGPENVANPTLSSLGTNFGLAPLVGKPTAIITDARLSGRADIAQVVERLLSISGEDGQTIDRKYLPAMTVKLPTRFMLISNELPRLAETSGALAGRMVILKLTRSFYGKEDIDLERRIMPELPGILLWAIEGWKRLQKRGQFVQPASAVQLVEEMEDLASPAGMFIKERCEIGPDQETPVKILFEAWREWCREKNREHVGDESAFGRNLRAVLPSLVTKPVKKDGIYSRNFVGVNLKVVF